MNFFVRALNSGLALAVLSLTAAAAATTPPPADRAFAHQLFKPVATGLAKSGVPVLLPGAIPADNAGLRAELTSAGASGYSIDLDFDPDCHGATACYLGQITGKKSDGSALHGKPVALSTGGTGYFVMGPCGASCSDSTITFDSNGYRYVFAEKGASQADLSEWVAAIVTLPQLVTMEGAGREA